MSCPRNSSRFERRIARSLAPRIDPAGRERSPLGFVDAGDAIAATMRFKDGIPRVDADVAREAMDSRARGGRSLLARRQVHLELLVVNDKARCAQFASGSSMTAAELAEMHRQTIHVVNLVASLYSGAFSWEFTIVLVGQEDWTASEPISVAADGNGETDAEDLLDALNAWRGANLGTLPQNDVAHLFSGRDFDGQTVGLAPQQGSLREHLRRARTLRHGVASGSVFQPGQCVESEAYGVRCCHHWAAGAISEVHKDEFGTPATTVAHEIGHQLGFQHDGEAGEDGYPTTQRGAACSEHGHIMAAVGTSGLVSTWSTCSKETFDETIPHFDCLRSGATAACGNGIVDMGEECDCGPDGCDGVDPCCDGATCQLTAGSECSETQGCCSSVVPSPRTRCAARRRGFCDAAETCSGTSAECPADEGKPLGTACVEDNGDKGACWGTTCENRERSCQPWGRRRQVRVRLVRLVSSDIGPLNGPFTSAHCTGGPRRRFDDANVRQLQRAHVPDGEGGARVSVFHPGERGVHARVQRRSVRRRTSRLRVRLSETLTPQPPPPPLPPFPAGAPRAAPGASLGFLRRTQLQVAENIEPIGSLVAVVFVIFVLALWKYWSRRKRQPVPVTRQVEMMPAGAAPQGWYPPPPGQGRARRWRNRRARAVSAAVSSPAAVRRQYAQQYPQNPQHYPQYLKVR